MPKVKKGKGKGKVPPAPKRKATKIIDETSENESATVVDKTDETSASQRGTKRKASSLNENVAKKSSSTVTNDSTQEIEEEPIQRPSTMTLKTSDRLSSNNEKASLKIASWNINGIRAWLKSGALKYIEEEKPDMMCFQEMKCEKEKIPEEATPAGYKSFWLSGDTAGYSGVGLLTKIDPISVTFGIEVEEHDNEGRVITAEYEKFYLVVSYIPNSGRNLVRLTYRQQFNQAFHQYLKKLDQKKPVVWCGDLNVSHLSIDLANPKTNTKTAGFTQEERDDFSKILADGFIDAYRSIYPEEPEAYTFWSYFRNARARNIGWRLDYFIISSRLQERLCDVLHQTGVYGSDHCPIVLLLAV